MNQRMHRPMLWMTIATVSMAAAALAGCGRTREHYVPAGDAARQALEKALAAWQQGQPPGRIEGRPVVQVGDTRRRPGQRLARFEIVGELPSDEGRLFAVRTFLDSPSAEEKTNFLVVGIDPLWVFRQEDYQMVTHWDCVNVPANGSTSSAQP